MTKRRRADKTTDMITMAEVFPLDHPRLLALAGGLYVALFDLSLDLAINTDRE